MPDAYPKDWFETHPIIVKQQQKLLHIRSLEFELEIERKQLLELLPWKVGDVVRPTGLQPTEYVHDAQITDIIITETGNVQLLVRPLYFQTHTIQTWYGVYFPSGSFSPVKVESTQK